jgi:hypothetical protein
MRWFAVDHPETAAWTMRLIIPWVLFVSFVARVQGYTLDDRDSNVVYYGKTWEQFSSGEYFDGTT